MPRPLTRHRRLTAEQQQLVVANVQLARDVKRRLFRGRDDEYEGAALEGLCKAAVQWVPGTGSFEGYAQAVVRGTLIDFHRKWHRENGRKSRSKKWRILSTDKLPDPESDESLLDACGFYEPDTGERVVHALEINEALDELDPRLRSRVLRYAAGFTMKEIGEADDVTLSAVAQGFKNSARRHQKEPDE